MKKFTHLHLHTHYSILDGMIKINTLVDRVAELGMNAVAITDHGNMFGVKEFHDTTMATGREYFDKIKIWREHSKYAFGIDNMIGNIDVKINEANGEQDKIDFLESKKIEFKEKAEKGKSFFSSLEGKKSWEWLAESRRKFVKPIIGIEAYMVDDRTIKQKGDKKNHIVLLAKNLIGYKNLMKLSSFAYIEGFYSKPRIDWELLEKYHEGIIVSTACIAGAVPRAVINDNMNSASELIERFKSIFGGDFYLELQRHKTTKPELPTVVYERQTIANQGLFSLARKHNVKLIATNDVHFLKAEDADAHDHLLCISTRKDYFEPNRLRYTQQEWLKSPEEMADIFYDLPEVFDNIEEITRKIEVYTLERKPIMPEFPLPEPFDDENEYLTHLVYQGAKIRYGEEIEDSVKERLDFELDTIKNMGFPGYFLITWDFMRAARDMGVLVGPGRGSAAGSAVSYCLKITDIDPIKYGLLFERFLNPERISMPDIDIDFDDDGREKIIEWVEKTYSHEKVANIITFGSIAAKSAIKDIARVRGVDLAVSNKMAKLVPEIPKITLEKAYKESKELDDIRKGISGEPYMKEILEYGEKVQKTNRNTGLHACGLIISKDPLYEHIPVSISKDSKLLVTQFDGRYVESVGMLKMDFLGLKTLSIIGDALKNIKLSKNVDVDLENVDLEDLETYKLYQKGDTIGLFQFESAGMQKYLKDLKPTEFNDLIAMNALYRPGPMEYIPTYINRKFGKEEVKYDHPLLEKYIKDTYGITVYQEQVMLLSRELANFTRGESDTLRKAMGKKKVETMQKLFVKFNQGCQENPEFMKYFDEKGDYIDQDYKARFVAKKEEQKKQKMLERVINKIWTDWVSFASYAFNKSHATCYSFLSFQTAYLKAHYPAEYMASVLTHNLSSIEKVTFFIEETKNMGINVLGPSINESREDFFVNPRGEIRYGMAALKGVGEGIVKEIIRERNENGRYTNYLDFFQRVAVNKSVAEGLVKAGALDDLGATRAQLLFVDINDNLEIDKLCKYGANYRKNQTMGQASLFEMDGQSEEVDESFNLPTCEDFGLHDRLRYEYESVGFYLSGHPLDFYKVEQKYFSNVKLSNVKDLSEFEGKRLTICGLVTHAEHRVAKNGNGYASVVVDDGTGSISFNLFKDKYLAFKTWLCVDTFVYLSVILKANVYKEVKRTEVWVEDISLLSELIDKRIKEIELTMLLNKATQLQYNLLLNFIESNLGRTKLSIKVFIEEKNKKSRPVRLRSKDGNLKVDAKSFIECVENEADLDNIILSLVK